MTRRRPPLAFRLLAVVVLGAATMAAAAPVPVWWRRAVFYEIFVRSFADATHGPLARDGIGDLQGLLDHLDYLNDGNPHTATDLGVTALWLMPVYPSPSYHGYDVTDYFGVNPQYGDTALLRRLVQKAHRRGMHVILDLVLNHASSRLPLFQRALAGPADSAARRMFRFAARPEQPAGPWGAPAWHRAPDGSWYYGVFSAEMPDWNFRNPAVTAHHRRVARYWLRDVGVDGFRLDAVRYFYEDGRCQEDLPETKAWLRDFTAYCHAIKPGSFVVGECAAGTTVTSDYLNHHALDSLFEFDFARDTIAAVNQGRAAIYAAQLARMRRDYATPDVWGTFLSNHDQERVASQLADDPTKLRFAAELELTAPGIPFIYYGEEIGMTGRKPDPDLRTPMQWTAGPHAGFSAVRPWHAINPDYRTCDVAAETADPHSLLSLYRRLIRLHQDSPALRSGQPVPVSAVAPNVYITMRQSPTDAVLILANFNSTPVPCPTVSASASRLRPDWRISDELALRPLAPLKPAADGSFRDWMPVPALPGRSVTIIRWRQS